MNLITSIITEFDTTEFILGKRPKITLEGNLVNHRNPWVEDNE